MVIYYQFQNVFITKLHRRKIMKNYENFACARFAFLIGGRVLTLRGSCSRQAPPHGPALKCDGCLFVSNAIISRSWRLLLLRRRRCSTIVVVPLVLSAHVYCLIGFRQGNIQIGHKQCLIRSIYKECIMLPEFSVKNRYAHTQPIRQRCRSSRQDGTPRRWSG